MDLNGTIGDGIPTCEITCPKCGYVTGACVGWFRSTDITCARCGHAFLFEPGYPVLASDEGASS